MQGPSHAVPTAWGWVMSIASSSASCYPSVHAGYQEKSTVHVKTSKSCQTSLYHTDISQTQSACATPVVKVQRCCPISPISVSLPSEPLSNFLLTQGSPHRGLVEQLSPSDSINITYTRNHVPSMVSSSSASSRGFKEYKDATKAESESLRITEI